MGTGRHSSLLSESRSAHHFRAGGLGIPPDLSEPVEMFACQLTFTTPLMNLSPAQV
jgi:hypothetical protein